MTFGCPDTGDTLGLSFIIPRTREDLERRRVMMLNWARTTCGMMGRSPDFMNVTFACWAGCGGLFRPRQAGICREHAALLPLHCRKRPRADPSLINLQRSRNVSGMFNLQEGTALQVVKETSAGIIVRGARVLATLGPLADEIAVYAPRLAQHLDQL